MSVASHSQKDEANVKLRREVMSVRGEGEQSTAQIRVELKEAAEKAAQLTQQVRARFSANSVRCLFSSHRNML